jgi:hypothetical protein
MIDRSISTSQQRLSNLLRAPTVHAGEITEAILDGSGLQQTPAPSETPKGKPMTSPSHAASTVTSMLANLEERSGKIVDRAVRIEKRAHVAYDKYDAALDDKEAEVAALEDALNQHSNGGED